MLQMRVITRKRYEWDATCERMTKTKSDKFWSALHSIRSYFYTNEELKRFAELSESHSHGSSADSGNIYHDDNHMDDFHIHLEHLPIHLTIE